MGIGALALIVGAAIAAGVLAVRATQAQHQAQDSQALAEAAAANATHQAALAQAAAANANNQAAIALAAEADAVQQAALAERQALISATQLLILQAHMLSTDASLMSAAAPSALPFKALCHAGKTIQSSNLTNMEGLWQHATARLLGRVSDNLASYLMLQYAASTVNLSNYVANDLTSIFKFLI